MGGSRNRIRCPADFDRAPPERSTLRLYVRPRPPLFRALGAADPPREIEVDGAVCYREEVLKHDSWAATAVYCGLPGRVVCKFNRQQSIFGISMRWLGRWLARHETWMLQRLQATGRVPTLSGKVAAGGRPLDYAVAHQYIYGHPLSRNEVVGDDFFPSLRALLDQMHQSDMAYVDLHKRENIIVGSDGRPYLIDFQISLAIADPRLARLAPIRTLLRFFQLSDDYHLLKHWAYHRPDQCGVSVADLDRHRPWWIRLHRLLAVPFRSARRRLLAGLHIRSQAGQASSEFFAEHAIRQEQQSARKAA